MAWRRSKAPKPAAVRASSTVEQRLAAIRAARTSGSPVTVDQLPIVQGLATLHADVAAQFPLYAVDERGRRLLDTFPVLQQPDPSECLGDTVHTIVQSMFYTGNAVAVRAGDAIRVQNPTACTVAPSFDLLDDRRIDGWIIHGLEVPVDNVVLWKMNDDPRRGPLGASPLQRCWQAVENYAWAYRYLADFFMSGGNPSLLLKSRNAADPGQADELWLQWVEARRAGRPAVVPWDIDVVNPGLQNDLADTVAVLEFCTAEICRATNTPPSLGNAPVASALTYANTLDELRRWLALSFGPTWLTRLERGFSTLLPDGVYARFDTSELPRLDQFSPVAAAPVNAPAPPGSSVAGAGAPPQRLEIVA